MLFEIGPSAATTPDTLTQIEIWVHTANIPGLCLWIDTPHAYVWATWNFHFLMGGPRFEIHFPPAKNLSNPVLAKYLINIHKMAATKACRFLKTLLLTFLTRPTVQCTLCHVYCAMYTVSCLLCSVHCVMCHVQCTLCHVYCAVCTVYCLLCSVHCVMSTV